MSDPRKLDASRPVHFVGIGGCSMSGLALMLHHRGYRVSGSDRAENANLLALRRAGIPVTVGHRAEALPASAGLIIVSTAAIRPDTAELVAGRARGVPVVDRAQLLAALMAEHRIGIAVAGTRGKTTTASLLASILTAAGLDPAVSVGSAVAAVAGNYRLGSGPCFIAEACEYQRAFWNLRPQVAVVLNIAVDHSDCFTDLADVTAAFRGFAERVDSAGLLVVAADVAAALAGSGPTRPVTFGLQPGPGGAGTHYRAQITGWSVGRARLLVSVDRYELGALAPRLLGEHNAHNVLAAVAVGHQLGVDLAVMREAVEAFAGAPRRLQVRLTEAGLRVVDDIACHPGEIAATMAAVRRVSTGGRIVVVLRPNSFTRVRDFLGEYPAAFAAGETILVTDIYPGRDTTTNGVHARDLVRVLRASGLHARYLPDLERADRLLARLLNARDTLVTIGPGDTGTLAVPALTQLSKETL